MEVKPIIVEETFSAPVAEVWEAITDPVKMRQWFFDAMKDFRAVAGFETKFNVHANGRDYLHWWKITEVIPGKKIAYTWRYENYSGNSFVTWELFPENGKTKLKLTAAGIETFPQDIPEFTRESCTAGWNYFIRERLKEFLS